MEEKWEKKEQEIAVALAGRRVSSAGPPPGVRGSASSSAQSAPEDEFKVKIVGFPEDTFAKTIKPIIEQISNEVRDVCECYVPGYRADVGFIKFRSKAAADAMIDAAKSGALNMQRGQFHLKAVWCATESQLTKSWPMRTLKRILITMAEEKGESGNDVAELIQTSGYMGGRVWLGERRVAEKDGKRQVRHLKLNMDKLEEELQERDWGFNAQDVLARYQAEAPRQ